MWDAWFSPQIVYFNIELLWIINKMVFSKSQNVRKVGTCYLHDPHWQALAGVMDAGVVVNNWTPREEIAITARPKIQSQAQIFRYSQSIFCLPRWPNFTDIFDLCLLWVSAVVIKNPHLIDQKDEMDGYRGAI